MSSTRTGECRITVTGPGRRVDLVVPATTAVAHLIPVLLRHTAEEAVPEDRTAAGVWVLQRLGQQPFAPDGTPESLDWLDGEELHLRRTEDTLPELDFDDLADGIATVVNRRPDRWQPEYRRHLFLALFAAQLATTGWLLLRWAPLLVAVAVPILLGATVLTLRRRADHGLAVLLFVAAAVCTAAAVTPAPAGFLVRPAGVLVALGLALIVFAPKLVLRIARLRGPQLPRTGDELKIDSEPMPSTVVSARADAADVWLSTSVTTVALVMTALFPILTGAPGWAGPALTGVVSAALLLRARQFQGVWQRVPLTVAGSIGYVLVLAAAGSLGAGVRAGLLAATLVVTVALLFAALRPWPRRLLPVWEFTATGFDVATALAVLPILLQVLGLYAWARGLFG